MEWDLSDVKPSLLSWVIVGLMAVSFIVLGKWAMQRFPVPGLKQVFDAA